jgi:hypothetical protein
LRSYSVGIAERRYLLITPLRWFQMIYRSILTNVGSDAQKLLKGKTLTGTQQGDFHKLTVFFFFKIREVG